MGRTAAAVGSTAFFIAAPGVVAGLIPWWLTGWEVREPLLHWGPTRIIGVTLIAAGAVVLINAFVRFVAEGAGTPAPVAPTERLVVGGLYRYVRNPMYLAVVAIIIGQALVLGSTTLLAYSIVVVLFFVTFVKLYEEPTLRRRYGVSYDAYRRAVPGWLPQLRAWTGDDDQSSAVPPRSGSASLRRDG
ncbi:MAG: isoprenylcysteine carboxylmethyltransferase family protein [Gemmatimonadaceae bacterium]